MGKNLFFGADDYRTLDYDYFTVENKSAYHIMVISNNTGHYWVLETKVLDDQHRSIIIHHKHKATDEYHIQPNFHPKDVKEAQELIKKHDDYVLGVKGS